MEGSNQREPSLSNYLLKLLTRIAWLVTFIFCVDASVQKTRTAFSAGRSLSSSLPPIAASVTDGFEILSVHEDDRSEIVDNRPFAQRVTRSRPARRLNHGFKYLYRHEDGTMPIHDSRTGHNLTSLEFLVQYGGYTKEQVYNMNQTFPPLLSLDVRRHLRPKMRFLQETICGFGKSDHLNPNRTLSQKTRQGIPPQYYGARLERTIAPRHAFLAYQNLPHGYQLLDDDLWQEFLLSCRKTKQFCAMCNTWKKKYDNSPGCNERITVKQIEAFDVMFQRGLMPAARNELCQSNNSWPHKHINITSAEVIGLLIQHGANPLENDTRGASLLHWAAGCGNLEAVKELLPSFPGGVFTETARDGATSLHWAAAGANAREFGIGGHVDVCRYLLENANVNKKGVQQQSKTITNQLTKDGNSVLMWSGWSGTLDAVKLLIRNRADSAVANRNGCTVAHWASSGGNLEVCRYLAETAGVDCTTPNYGGNTPLTHAVAFGRVDVVDWLRREICNSQDDEIMAAQLAQDFVGWTEGGDIKRTQVLSLFQDWNGAQEDDNIESSTDDVEKRKWNYY